MNNLILLGASGSIGSQCLKVIASHEDELNLIGISIYNEEDILHDVLATHKNIKYVCIGEKMNLNSLKERYPSITFFVGKEGLNSLASIKTDLLINAISGFAGLEPVVAGIKAHNDIALANKECLVAAGDLVTELANKMDVEIYPIDSEHNAIYQCLKGEKINGVRRLIITASGGPFRDKSLSELADVTVEQALHHPTWKMGPKISIDSATLVNKGLEVIEAHHLFSLDYNRIDVVMQLESIVHSMVEFKDGSIKALLGAPNMEVPIQYALFKGEHKDKYDANLALNKPFSLNFRPIDPNRFEAVLLAYEVGKKGGSYPIVFNAANEVAVHSFINHKLPFNKIVDVIKETLNRYNHTNPKTLEEIISVDNKARELAENVIRNICC